MSKRHRPFLTPVRRYGARFGFDEYWTTGRRKQVRRATLKLAQKEAADLAALIARGRKDLAGTTAAEWAQFRRWRQINLSSQRVADGIKEFMAAKRAEGDAGRKWIEKLDDYLELVRAEFGDRLFSEIREQEISEWLRARQLPPRSRNNLRAPVVQLFRWARSRHYLPDQTTEAERVPKLKVKRAETITTWTPEEMAARLAAAALDDRVLPLVGAFAGVRPEEMLPEYDDKAPLQWEDFDWAENLIHLRAVTSKVNEARDIPISPQLKAWLQPYRHRHGPCLRQQQTTTKVNQRIAGACGIPHRKNADRHCYGTYRMVEIKDIEQVANEMGTGIYRVKTNYSRPKNPSVLAAWKSIYPPGDAKIIPLRPESQESHRFSPRTRHKTKGR